MNKYYKLDLYFKNGRKISLPPQNSTEKAIEEMNKLLNQATLYYNRNGINYGIFGKVFTFEEDNDGLERAEISVFEKVDFIVIKE